MRGRGLDTCVVLKKCTCNATATFFPEQQQNRHPRHPTQPYSGVDTGFRKGGGGGGVRVIVKY